jgi:hypothetical protein
VLVDRQTVENCTLNATDLVKFWFSGAVFVRSFSFTAALVQEDRTMERHPLYFAKVRLHIYIYIYIYIEQSLYRPGVAQRVPGS